MPNFSLTLEIDEANLKILLAASEKLVIAKAPNGTGSTVAWAVSAPFQSNLVSWVPEYALYAQQSQDPLTTVVTTDFPTPSGVAYRLEKDGRFQQTGKDLFPPTGTYRIFNGVPTSEASELSFGLVQQVNMNGLTSKNRISTTFIPSEQLADFTPDDTVIVWLATGTAAGDKVTIPPPVGVQRTTNSHATVMSRSTKISFGGSLASATYTYSASLGGFVPAGEA